MPRTLYKVYSYVTNFKNLGEVYLEWVYHFREAPVAPYKDMIHAYDNLSEKDQEYARDRVDEMFTEEELAALSRRLEKAHRMECFSIEKPLPVKIDDMVDKKVAPRDSWVPGSILMFSRMPGYDLPFEVWAYYDLRRNPVRDDKKLLRLIRDGRDRIYTVAEEVFATMSGIVTCLHGYVLDCGCIALRQRFPDGSFNRYLDIRNSVSDSPCEVCKAMAGSWESRVVDEVVVYNSKIQVG